MYIDSYYRNLIEKTENRQKRQESLQNEIKNLSPEEAKEKELALSQAESENLRLSRHKISIKDFVNVRLIGRGAFGEVRVVRKKQWPGEEPTEKVYAMKIMNKDFMIQKNQLAHARAERDAMVEHDDPGIVKLYFSFQDFRFLYFVMEYLPGGDLMNLLIKREILSEAETRFYITELIEAVQAIHRHGYIHRDLKPDNILIGADGHIKLSDFGLCTSGAESHLSSFYNAVVPSNFDKAKQSSTEIKTKPSLERRNSWKRMRKTMSYSTVGTSNYMAPEILLEKGYGPEVDWWSVGVILYECLIGYAPFSCEDTTETCIMILEFKQSLDFPNEPHITDEAYDLIKNCLLVEQEERVSYDELASHPWFTGTNFKTIRQQKAPWVPELDSEVDTSNFDDFEDDNADFFFGDDYTEGFEDPTAKPLKDWDPKHLPFVGWTFKRFEPKDRPSVNSVFQSGTDSGHATTTQSNEAEDKKAKKGKIAVWSRKK
uniref:non-specific serine/threonine protein kinase n=1 Tax=Arcella intermedia TaxID=1963864 RepID=A0A6B2L2Q8_9EUKA